MILAGDIGGTSTRLAWFELAGGRLRPAAGERYRSRDHPGLEAILRAFLAAHPGPLEAAGFGIAGPVLGGRVAAPNLPWVVEQAALARALGTPSVALLNDLAATAHGLAELEGGDLAVLNAGAAGAAGNLAVIAAGTGLGEAGAYFDGRRHHPFASEGGHADFAPRSELEAELLAHLRRRFPGHVSVERVVSGPGLLRIYEFLRESGRGAEEPWLREALAGDDPPAAISKAALEGKSELCARALDLFASLYGAEAGNLALKVMATGGVYVAGGIAPRIVGKLLEPGFMESFADKGRMRPLLEAMPVRVVLNERAALLGAARQAARCAGLGDGG